MTTHNQELACAKLLLERQFPNHEDVWLEGYEEGMMQLDEMVNPYPIHSIEHDYWQQGWWSAFYEEAPLFNLDGSVVESRHESATVIELDKYRQSPAHIPEYSSVRNRRINWVKVCKISAALLAGTATAALVYDLAV